MTCYACWNLGCSKQLIQLSAGLRLKECYAKNATIEKIRKDKL